MSEIGPDYMTAEEVATLTRKSAATMRYLRHIGRGPRSFKLGRRVLYARPDVMAWIEAAHRAGRD